MILQLQVISNLLCNVAANFVDPFIRLVDKNCWSDGIVMMTKEVLEVAPTTNYSEFLSLLATEHENCFGSIMFICQIHEHDDYAF